MDHSNRAPFPQYLVTLIKVAAQKMLGKYRLSESDRKDLEQQLAMEVVRRRRKFDPSKAQENTFLSRLVNHAKADIIAARKASNRDYRREEGSLDQSRQDDGTRLGDTLTEDDGNRRVGRPSSKPGILRDLTIDLRDAVSKLPPRLRIILGHYSVLGSARAVAKALGLHHSSVCDAMQQIRKHLTDAGLEDYV